MSDFLPFLVWLKNCVTLWSLSFYPSDVSSSSYLIKKNRFHADQWISTIFLILIQIVCKSSHKLSYFGNTSAEFLCRHSNPLLVSTSSNLSSNFYVHAQHSDGISIFLLLSYSVGSFLVEILSIKIAENNKKKKNSNNELLIIFNIRIRTFNFYQFLIFQFLFFNISLQLSFIFPLKMAHLSRLKEIVSARWSGRRQ